MSRFPAQPPRLGRTCPLLLAYDAKKRTANVRFRGEIRELKARVDASVPLTVNVHGFAAAFHSGGKIWPATVTFVELTAGSFRYDDLTIHGFVPSGNGNPPHVTGFIKDSRASDVGIPQGSAAWLRAS